MPSNLSGSGSGCVLTVPLDITEDGDYSIDVWAWADQAGDDLAKMDVLVESDTESSAGAHAIRSTLVELYDKLLGVAVPPDSPEISQAYGRFVEIWEDKRELGDHFLWNDEGVNCEWGSDGYYFDGIPNAEGLWNEEHGSWDGDRVREFFGQLNLSDTRGAARTWTVVLAYLLMDYRYLHL